MSHMSPQEFTAHKAAQRVEQVESMQAPLRERRSKLESRQAYVDNELEKRRADPATSIAKITELEREWDTMRQVETRLNEQEAVATRTLVRLRG